ncbi:hypothetical protein [Actinomadura parmotrematis]|uniref:Uncharacterized protein n=1 Tax=Actinomadura parmotrematis TaxID=2864039 RepID=A0ABS7FXW6_9ACTN|nr:hypothetical protein [Actinomadura parmotrematis]MBW8485268.1 hypothetical protein [Actinomadura parmotrematis]
MGGNRIDQILNSPARDRSPSGDPSGGPPAPGPAKPEPGMRPAKSSGEVRFAPDDLRKLGDEIETELQKIFTQARYKLNAAPRDVQSDAFTTFAYTCAAAYTQVIEFVDEDLKTKTRYAMDVNDRLHKAAGVQDEAERKSTIKKGD